MTKAKRRVPIPEGHSGLSLHKDPEAIRRRQIKAYRTKLADIQKAHEKMRRFREVDQPAFTLWWQRTFADDLMEQMELEKKYTDLQLLSDAVSQYKTHYRCTYREAYDIVVKSQKEGRFQELMKAMFEEIDGARETSAKAPWDERVDDDLDLLSILEQIRAEKERQRDRTEKPRPQKTAASEDTTDDYLKKIYRDLVLKLHPDMQKGKAQSREEKALWHELQDAYAWRDLSRMEAIYKTLAGHDSPVIDFATIPIGDIMSMRDDLSKQAKKLNRELRAARQEANWDFNNRQTDRRFLKSLAESIEEQLAEHTMALEYSIDELRQQLKNWTTPRKRSTSSNTKRRSPSL